MNFIKYYRGKNRRVKSCKGNVSFSFQYLRNTRDPREALEQKLRYLKSFSETREKLARMSSMFTSERTTRTADERKRLFTNTTRIEKEINLRICRIIGLK